MQAFAGRIGAEPLTDAEVAEVLDLAATAAHGAEKTTAPLACFLAGRTGRPAAELRRLAEELE